MRRLILWILVLSITTISQQLQAQSEEQGILGDNFSLEGALELFKDASNLEDFEAKVNDQDSNVNNLDLNDDQEIDYIRVEEIVEGDVHAIVLQALISEEESQDVAVIEIEKTGDESATLQIVGDEDLYGKEYYVEPFDEVGVSDGKGGPSADYRVSRLVVNVWFWPSVRHIYRSNHVVYRSPFRWRVYPRVWRPWRPLTWNVYHGKRVRYHRNYRTVKTHRVVSARKIYKPRRKTSTVVVRKSKTVTRTRTTRNGTKAVSRTKTTKTVKKNRKGNLKTNKKTTKRKVKKKKRKSN